MPNLSKFQKDGKFLMLAFDHRGSFKKLMNPENPDSVTDEEAISLKKEIIDSLRGQFTSLLIDQEIGLKAYEPRDVPYLLPIEKTGYEVTGEERLTELENSVESLKAAGASGVKILVWFNPYVESAQKQLEISKKVMEECQAADMPYFLEIRTYDGKREADKMGDDEREKIILESIKMFLRHDIFPDVYKLEYPASALACQTISAALQLSEREIPWILLTMGSSFDDFVAQLKEASIRGCKGFLAGRAVWQEVCAMKGEEKQKFLKETLPERFKIISEIMVGNAENVIASKA
jgi:tagatose 1,6-diphosphate aldolase